MLVIQKISQKYHKYITNIFQFFYKSFTKILQNITKEKKLFVCAGYTETLQKYHKSTTQLLQCARIIICAGLFHFMFLQVS